MKDYGGAWCVVCGGGVVCIFVSSGWRTIMSVIGPSPLTTVRDMCTGLWWVPYAGVSCVQGCVWCLGSGVGPLSARGGVKKTWEDDEWDGTSEINNILRIQLKSAIWYGLIQLLHERKVIILGMKGTFWEIGGNLLWIMHGRSGGHFLPVL